MKIALGCPTNRLVKPKTAQSLLELVAFSEHDYKILVSSRGFNTSENRNWIATQAVNSGCDYLFFVDDDMILYPETLEELLLCDKDIVGCVYKTKYEVQADVCEYFDEDRPQGLFKVKAIGTGCLLIKCDVFKKLPQNYKNTKGWFNYIWNDNGSVAMSHDWLFCQNARDFGYDVWALNTLIIGHIGQKIY
jgi:hypothetical protein